GIRDFHVTGVQTCALPIYRYLPLDRLVPPDRVPSDPELFIAFDTGSPDRLGELGSVAKGAGTVVVVDHHVTNEGFGDIALVEPRSEERRVGKEGGPQWDTW